MNTKSLSDAQLVNNYISGQESALSVLINRHQQRLYGFIFSKVYDRDATEDIFQDTFVKVIKTLKKGKYNEQGKFLPWVMRIAHNLVIDFFRKNNTGSTRKIFESTIHIDRNSIFIYKSLDKEFFKKVYAGVEMKEDHFTFSWNFEEYPKNFSPVSNINIEFFDEMFWFKK